MSLEETIENKYRSRRSHYHDNRATLRDRRSQESVKKLVHRNPIPEDDLIIIEQLYHKQYPDCGRKRGALLRYIKAMREEHHPKTNTKEVINLIYRAHRRSSR